MSLRAEIEGLCRRRFGITFVHGLRQHGLQLLGAPAERHIHAWAGPRRGYLLLEHFSVVMMYQYAGLLANGLSYNQLEYRNTDQLSPIALITAMQALGAPDVIVQSHSRNGGHRDYWAAIGCLNYRADTHYRFRLIFPSQDIAETVYANYRTAASTNTLPQKCPKRYGYYHYRTCAGTTRPKPSSTHRARPPCHSSTARSVSAPFRL
jgi:hypothetical protein